jgi:hypothetical protein
MSRTGTGCTQIIGLQGKREDFIGQLDSDTLIGEFTKVVRNWIALNRALNRRTP